MTTNSKQQRQNNIQQTQTQTQPINRDDVVAFAIVVLTTVATLLHKWHFYFSSFSVCLYTKYCRISCVYVYSTGTVARKKCITMSVI